MELGLSCWRTYDTQRFASKVRRPFKAACEACGERVIAEPPGSDPTGLLRSAELDIECMPFYYRWTANSTRLAVYKDGTRSDCYFEEEFSSQNLQLDTTDMVRKFNEMSEMEGVCVPLC